MLKMHK
jgi:hypothetical protein